MNDGQENKFTMYEATMAIMDEYEAIWTTVAAVSDITSKITNIITDIGNFRQIQVADTTGITIDKNAIKEDLIQATLKVINGLVAYAVVNDDNELRNRVNYTRSDLEYSRENILVDKARLIYETALPLAADLVAYLVAQEDIDAITNLLKDFEQALPEKRLAVTQSKYSTEAIRDKFREADGLLRNKLDKLILIFQPANPEFVSRYFNARIIIDLGIRHTTNKTIISGLVENKATQQPLSGVNVWILDKGLNCTTGPNGRFSIEVPEGGTYTVKAEKTGYATYTHDPVTIQKGTEAQIEIELTAL
ncbi:MAG: carboxypeptidase regulatory-like domain-containing protein [Bacteroidales bacterium]